MRIIAGLGNPGKEYEGTRHNAGFMALQKLAHDNDISIVSFERHALTGKGMIQGEKVLLVMPQTYMNLSGVAIRTLLDYYKEPVESLIVIYDDVSLDPGRIRIRQRGSAGGHNGIKNIIEELGTDEFDRVKIGVGQKPPHFDLVDWVLGRFKKEDLTEMEKAIEKTAEAVECMIKEGTPAAMTSFNGFSLIKEFNLLTDKEINEGIP